MSKSFGQYNYNRDRQSKVGQQLNDYFRSARLYVSSFFPGGKPLYFEGGVEARGESVLWHQRAGESHS
jgi:hypothetical protein